MPNKLTLITGTTGGIGSALSNILLESNYDLHEVNRRPKDSQSNHYIADMSSKESIDSLINQLEHVQEKFNLVILNAGTKATRKRTLWNGKLLNICRVTNLIANKYLLEKLIENNLIATDANVVFITSITHWGASTDPCRMDDEGNDSTNASKCSEHYPIFELA